MPRFRILYLAAERGEAFRARPLGKPPYVLRRSHYEDGPEVSADSPYALWSELRKQRESDVPDAQRPVDVGDVLEAGDQLLLCNYSGFDAAEWHEAAAARDTPGNRSNVPAAVSGASEVDA